MCCRDDPVICYNCSSTLMLASSAIENSQINYWWPRILVRVNTTDNFPSRCETIIWFRAVSQVCIYLVTRSWFKVIDRIFRCNSGCRGYLSCCSNWIIGRWDPDTFFTFKFVDVRLCHHPAHSATDPTTRTLLRKMSLCKDLLKIEKRTKSL